jgi:hypothetical protein
LAAIAGLIVLCVTTASIVSVFSSGSSQAVASQNSSTHPLTTLNSFFDAWGGTTFAKSSSGSDCLWEGSSPSYATSGSSGISISANLNPNPVSGGCTPMWMYGEANAGWHACASSCANFAPTQTRFYNVTATWELTINVGVYAYCGSASSGDGLGDFAEVNVTPYMAIWNVGLGEDYTLVNTYYPLIQINTQDMACSSSSINVDKTWGQTVTMNTMAWLSSAYTYQPRAAIEAETFVVSTDSGGTAMYASGQFSVTGTLSSIAIN